MLKTKKRLTIVLTGLVLFGSLLFVLNKKNEVSKAVKNNEAHEVVFDLPESKINVDDIPKTTEKLKISGVEVDNFYKNPETITKDGDTVFKTNDKYEFAYFYDVRKFTIFIYGSPFEETRKIAEEAFLRELNISPSEACQLNVDIKTAVFANPEEAGKKHGLSFCNNNLNESNN